MNYVLGIDSGGTKYMVKACALDGTPLSEHVGEPAAHYRLPRAEVIRRIDEHIDRCLQGFGGDRADCVGIVCGTTGIDSPSDQRVVQQIYDGLLGFTCPTTCVNDAEIAHFAVTGGVGAVVIAGTGSIAYGRNASGETARSGGWPICIFGDEGSGTWIGYRALHHLALRFDERVPASPLAEMVGGRLGIGRREDLMSVCASIEQLTWDDPGLAAIVDEAAEAGDPHAIAILSEAADHTFALVDSVIRRLHLEDEPSFRVGAWGSAIARSRLHFRFYGERCQARYPNAEVLIADDDAAMGACSMALALLEIRP